MTLKIAIVGAGPAGCVLARLLQQSDEDIAVTIFEGEGDIDFRSQGGTLDLHEKTGQAALKAAGLFDEFLKYARYDGEAMVMFTPPISSLQLNNKLIDEHIDHLRQELPMLH